MKQINTILGIVSIASFLFYLMLDVSLIENDLENLSSFGYAEFLDGKIFLTLHDTLTQKEVKTIQRIESYFEVTLIIPVLEEVDANLHSRPREPP
jgi:hypothetical protein